MPVSTYLFVNNLSRKHMILIFEPNYSFKAFDAVTQEAPFTFLLADSKFKFGELAYNFFYITGVHQMALRQLKEDRDKNLICDDFIKVVNVDSEVSEIQQNYEIQEVEVVFRNVSQRYEADGNLESLSETEIIKPSATEKYQSKNRGKIMSKTMQQRFGNF